tara:strand:- start:1505 stop:8416 length:6912 start_codon:yes stop_codon:yes gene_type:complete
MELFESFGIDPAEAQANLSLDELNRLNELLAQKAMETQNVAVPTVDEAPGTFNPGLYPQAYGAEPQGLAADYYNSPPVLNVTPPKAAPLSRLDMNPVSHDPFTEEDNYQPAYVLDAMQQQAGPSPDMLDRPYREVDNLPEWGPSEMAQFQEKERIAKELGISPEVINQWNIPQIAGLNLEKWLLNKQLTAGVSKMVTPETFLNRDTGGGNKLAYLQEAYDRVLAYTGDPKQAMDAWIKAETEIGNLGGQLPTDVAQRMAGEEGARIRAEGAEQLQHNAARAARVDAEIGLRSAIREQQPKQNDFVKGFVQEFKSLGSNPKALAQLITGSLAGMPDTLVGSTLAAIAAGPAGAGAVAGLTLLETERASRFLEKMAEHGADLTDPRVLAALKKDPKSFYDRFVASNTEATKEAAVIAFFNALGVFGSGQLAKRIAKETLDKGGSTGSAALSAGLAGIPIETTTDVIGETVAPFPATGEFASGQEAAAEAIGGIGATAAPTAAAAVGALRNRSVGDEAAQDAAIREELIKQATDRGYRESDVDMLLDKGLQTEAEINRSTGTLSFNPEAIRNYLRGTGKKDIKNKVSELIRHEVVAHGGLVAWFKTGKGSKALGGIIDGLDAYLDEFDSKNKAKIDNWLKNTERGQVYDKELDGQRRRQVEEYIAIQIAEGLNTGPIRNILSKLKLLFKRATNVNFSENELRDILRQIQSDQKAGRLAPTTASKQPGDPDATGQEERETSPPDLEAGSMEAYQQAVAERQAAQDKMDEILGDIDDAVADTVRSTDPTKKLVEPRVVEDTLFSKQVKYMTDKEKLGRDVGYDVSRFGYKQIVGQPDEVEIRARLKRVQSLWGKPGQIREANPGTREFANELIDKAKNDPTGFEEAMAEFESVMAKPAQSHTKAGRRAKRARDRGVTVDQLQQYRDRDEIHPIEKKMTFTMAGELINELEAEGTINADTAEQRRQAVNEINAALKGRMPGPAKRTVTDAIYGLGTKFAYTESQKMDLEKKAEIARAKERTQRTRRVAPTEKQTEKTVSALPTPEEATLIEALRGSEAYDNLKTDRQRLRFLREKENLSDKERRQFEAFAKDPANWNEAEFEAAEAATREAQIAKVGVTRIEQTPEQRAAELDDMKRARQAYKEQRKIFQVEGGYYDTLAENEILSDQNEVLPEGFAIDEGTTLQSKRELKSLTPKTKLRVGDVILYMDKGTPRRAQVLPTYPEQDEDAKTGDDIDTTKPIRYKTRSGRNKLRGSSPINKLFAPAKRSSVGDENRAAAKAYSRFMYGPDTRIGKIEKEGSRLGPEFEVDHIQELLADVVDPYTGDIVVDTERGTHRSQNLGIIPVPIHQAKSDFVKNPIWGKDKYFRSTLDRGSTPLVDYKDPYTVMEDWIQNSDYILPEGTVYNKVNVGGQKATEVFTRNFDILGKEGENLSNWLTTMKMSAADGELFVGSVLANHQLRGREGIPDLTAAIARDDALRADAGLNEALTNTHTMLSKQSKKGYSEHFNDHFWYRLTSFLWGKPVQAIRDFNKVSRFGQAKGAIPAADEIADEIQRAHSANQRADELVYGTDMMQDTSLRSGEFFSELSKIFAMMTGRTGAINRKNNKTLVNVLIGKTRIQELADKKTRDAAEALSELIQKVYNYAKTETKNLDKPLDLRGHGDTLLPRVWNIEFLATRKGKAKFLRVVRNSLTNPETGSNILDETDLTIDDLYDVVINSGGFVQGDWTNLKADQTRSQKDIDRDLKAQEYLDSLETEGLLDDGLVLDDLQAIIPRFIQKAIERTEYSKRFGINDEILRAKIKEALAQIGKHNAEVLKLNPSKDQAGYIDPKRFEKTVWDMARILRNKYGYDITNMNTRTWLQRLANVQVIAKLPLVTLASMPELFTPMLRGSANPAAWGVDLMAGMAWAGYKGMNGISKLLFNTHLPAMRKASGDIGGLGIIRDVQMLREMGIAEIQAMGDLVSTRYANPNFARGGLRAGARGTISGKIPKQVRSVFNMQVFMQATMLTTLTEMQQLMALRNFQRHMARRVKFVNKNKDKSLKGRKLRLFNQFKQDMADFGLNMDIDLDTSRGEAEFNAGALRFIDQVITRPNDATTAKAFKNPLTAPIFLFKRFITTFGNTLMTAVGNDIANKVSNVERAKQAGRLVAAMTAMYGAVMFAEIIRGAIKGDLDEEDMTLTGGDFRSFMRRLDRTGLLSAPGAMAVNLAFPYKRGWWDTPEARLVGELGGPILGDAAELMAQATDPKDDSLQRLTRQIMPLSKKAFQLDYEKKKSKEKRNTNPYMRSSSSSRRKNPYMSSSKRKNPYMSN